MFTHFFYDLTHFDSSFFHTLRYLLLKPGFLTREYMEGRRVSYLHPIRMYVFCSAIFFLFFFTFFNPKGALTFDVNSPITQKERGAYIKKLQAKLDKDTANTFLKARLMIAKDSTRSVTNQEMYNDTELEEGVIHLGKKSYKSLEEYDSLERNLPSAARDGWFLNRLTRKSIVINNKYRQNPQEAWSKLGDNILHKLPYMLFVSLPLFALILRLVYLRCRKTFYFADHGVFTIHLYVFSFLVLFVMFGLSELQRIASDMEVVTLILFFSMPVYLYIAMLKFYRQGWSKTFIKFILVSLLSIIIMAVIFILFTFFSAFTL